MRAVVQESGGWRVEDAAGEMLRCGGMFGAEAAMASAERAMAEVREMAEVAGE